MLRPRSYSLNLNLNLVTRSTAPLPVALPRRSYRARSHSEAAAQQSKWQLWGQSQWAPSCTQLAVSSSSSSSSGGDKGGSRRVPYQNMNTTTANKTLNMRWNVEMLRNISTASATTQNMQRLKILLPNKNKITKNKHLSELWKTFAYSISEIFIDEIKSSEM